MPPSLYVFMGLIASGKSTLAMGLAQRFSLPYFNTDVVRKELAGKIPQSRQGSQLNQGIYTPEFTRKTYDTILEYTRSELCEKKRSVVVDGSYHKKSERQRVVHCAAECCAALYFILCQCDDGETKRRLTVRARDPKAVSDGTWEIFQNQKMYFEFPDEIPSSSLILFDTAGPSSELLDSLISLLSEQPTF